MTFKYNFPKNLVPHFCFLLLTLFSFSLPSLSYEKALLMISNFAGDLIIAFYDVIFDFLVLYWINRSLNAGILQNTIPAGISLLKVKNRSAKTRCEICLKLAIKVPERRQWCRSGVFIVNFEYISHLALVFLLLILSR